MNQIKHRNVLAEIMDTFGCKVREATIEALYKAEKEKCCKQQDTRIQWE